MVSTLVEQYRRWFEYEKDSHRKVLESLETVPEAGRASEPYQKALNIMGHIVAARLTWMHRLDPAFERPASIFPTGVTLDGLLADLDRMERDLDRLPGTADRTGSPGRPHLPDQRGTGTAPPSSTFSPTSTAIRCTTADRSPRWCAPPAANRR